MFAMDSALDLFGQVVHAGGAKVLDGDHQVPSAHITVAVSFVLVMLPVAVGTFAFTMKMSNSLFQFALQLANGFAGGGDRVIQVGGTDGTILPDAAGVWNRDRESKLGRAPVRVHW